MTLLLNLMVLLMWIPTVCCRNGRLAAGVTSTASSYVSTLFQLFPLCPPPLYCWDGGTFVAITDGILGARITGGVGMAASAIGLAASGAGISGTVARCSRCGGERDVCRLGKYWRRRFYAGKVQHMLLGGHERTAKRVDDVGHG